MVAEPGADVRSRAPTSGFTGWIGGVGGLGGRAASAEEYGWAGLWAAVGGWLCQIRVKTPALKVVATMPPFSSAIAAPAGSSCAP